MIIDRAVSEKCINHNAYSEICLGCNMCGRIDKDTMWQARYDCYVEELEELLEKLQDDFYQTDLQQHNIAIDIQYVGKKLEECVDHMTFKEFWSEEREE